MAFVKSLLRDMPSSEAKASASSNIGSGIEIAVFMDLSMTAVIPLSRL